MSQPQDPILTQLKRTGGQIDGIIDMYGNNRACIDIVHQVIAARNGLNKVARDLLTTEASECTKERRVEDLNAILKELFKY